MYTRVVVVVVLSAVFRANAKEKKKKTGRVLYIIILCIFRIFFLTSSYLYLARCSDRTRKAVNCRPRIFFFLLMIPHNILYFILSQHSAVKYNNSTPRPFQIFFIIIGTFIFKTIRLQQVYAKNRFIIL